MNQLPAIPYTHAYERAVEFANEALAPATLRAYRADWAHFSDWCRRSQVSPLPAEPETVAAYLASMANTHGRSTIQRRLIALGQAHRHAGHDWRSSHPAIRNTLKGMFRRHGSVVRKAAAIGRPEIMHLLRVCTGSFTARRDRALLLVGFSGALRRSELAGIHREDLVFRPDGMIVFLGRSKADQEGQGVEVGIPMGEHADTCPVRAMRAWLEASGCTSGPVFRMVRADGSLMDRALNPASINEILKRRAAEAGLEVDSRERLSAHGLRVGCITEAYRAGARDEDIMGHSRHRDLSTMRGYVRRAKLMSENPARLLGL